MLLVGVGLSDRLITGENPSHLLVFAVAGHPSAQGGKVPSLDLCVHKNRPESTRTAGAPLWPSAEQTAFHPFLRHCVGTFSQEKTVIKTPAEGSELRGCMDSTFVIENLFFPVGRGKEIP